jgi:hypothetical protein
MLVWGEGRLQLIGRPSDGEVVRSTAGRCGALARAVLTNLCPAALLLCGELVCRRFLKTFLRPFWTVTVFKEVGLKANRGPELVSTHLTSKLEHGSFYTRQFSINTWQGKNGAQ